MSSFSLVCVHGNCFLKLELTGLQVVYPKRRSGVDHVQPLREFLCQSHSKALDNRAPLCMCLSFRGPGCIKEFS